jgi:hypothetical protein
MYAGEAQHVERARQHEERCDRNAFEHDVTERMKVDAQG